MAVSLLSKTRLFEGLSEQDIMNIASQWRHINVAQGESVIAEHSHGDYLYLVINGSVEITKDLTEDSIAAQLKVMEAGDFFGEMSLIDQEPRSANVIACEDSELLIIPRESFMKIAYSYPTVLFNLIKTLSWRLRDTNQKFIDVMDKLISAQRMEAIGTAASKIIHDIKTPLTVIVLTAQLIENLSPQTADFTKSIVQQTQNIDQMVREILDFAKGKFTPIHAQAVNFKEFINDLRDTFICTLQGRNIEFQVENKVQQEVCFDENKIRRVLNNLLKNSLEAIKESGKISLQAYLDKNTLCLRVADTGPGVSPSMQQHLFEPFKSEGKSHGTGLGLAICQKLAHEHKGTIEYASLEPHGAIFTLRLPQSDEK